MNHSFSYYIMCFAVLILVPLTLLYLASKWKGLKAKELNSDGVSSLSTDLSSKTETLDAEKERQLNHVLVFENLFNSYPEVASRMIENFVSLGNYRPHRLFLSFLIENLSNEVMISLIKNCRQDTVSSWKFLLDDEDLHAKKSDFEEVFYQELLTHVDPKRRELLDIFLMIPQKKVANFLFNETYYASSLIHLFKGDFLNSIFQGLDSSTFAQVTKRSVSLSLQHVESCLDELIFKFQFLSKNNNHTHIIEKLSEMLVNVDPERENSIYRAIAEKSDRHYLVMVARANFPSELINDLHDDLLIDAFDNMTFSSKIGHLYNLSEVKREKFLDVISPRGTRNRDLINNEMKRINEDWSISLEIRRKKAFYNKDFVVSVRKALMKDDNHKQIVFPKIDLWASHMISSLNKNNSKVYGEYGTSVS